MSSLIFFLDLVSIHARRLRAIIEYEEKAVFIWNLEALSKQ